METTITKTVKGETMEAIFDNSETANVKYFKAIAPHDSGYNPEEKYKYEITIRHPEGTDANVIFEEARFRVENMTVTPKKKKADIDKTFKTEINKLQKVEAISEKILAKLESMVDIDPCGLERCHLINAIQRIISQETNLKKA
jgi:hypothetical protein